MAGRRRPKRQKGKAKKARADQEDDRVPAEHTAPTSGLNDVCFARGRRFIEELVAAQGELEQRDDIAVVRQCLRTSKYPEFEPPEAPNHARLTFG